MSIIGVAVSEASLTASISAPPVCEKPREDEWERLVKSLKDGTYKAGYEVGDVVHGLNAGKYGTFDAKIIAMDTDQINGTGKKAAFTFLLTRVLADRMKMNPKWAEEDPDDDERFIPGTGAVNGWMGCSLRRWLREEFLPALPDIVRENIVEVVKSSRTFTEKSQIFDVMTADKLWIPSRREVFGAGRFRELAGPIYDEAFDDDESRVILDKDGDPSWWWLRSALSNYSFGSVYTDGSNGYSYASHEGGVAVGFCLGSGI